MDIAPEPSKPPSENPGADRPFGAAVELQDGRDGGRQIEGFGLAGIEDYIDPYGCIMAGEMAPVWRRGRQRQQRREGLSSRRNRADGPSRPHDPAQAR